MQKNVQDVLDNLQIKSLNEMQEKTLQESEHLQDIVLLSNTGSGKTLAFLLPIFLRLKEDIKGSQALIVAPSRELSLQIEDVFKKMKTGFKVTCCYGGHKRETEENNLIDAPALIVATPGRLCDHIRRGNITLDSIQTLVLDEFDKSLELGFEEEMSFILNSLQAVTQKVLTSATETIKLPDFLRLNNPTRLSYLSNEAEDKKALLIQKVVARTADKFDILFRLICHLGNRSMIVFCNHREAVELVSDQLSERGINNVFYHGAVEQRDRDTALNRFRNGTVNVLVTTDIASRGLDIPNIRYIIHYQLPQTQEIFTHRNGRTARMDASGTAIILLSSQEHLPAYMPQDMTAITLPENSVLPEKTKWVTLYVGAGKKDKINKTDIVGFLTQIGKLKMEDIGLIEVKDYSAFVAISRLRATQVLSIIKDKRMKNKKVKLEIAK